MVPIGERALAWIDRYVIEVRPSLLVEPDEGYLFLTHLGESFTPNRLTQLVREYVDKAAIGKRGACHLFRHTMATLMLEGGADVRFIQEMLGDAPGRAARAREGRTGDVARGQLDRGPKRRDVGADRVRREELSPLWPPKRLRKRRAEVLAATTDEADPALTPQCNTLIPCAAYGTGARPS